MFKTILKKKKIVAHQLKKKALMSKNYLNSISLNELLSQVIVHHIGTN